MGKRKQERRYSTWGWRRSSCRRCWVADALARAPEGEPHDIVAGDLLPHQTHDEGLATRTPSTARTSPTALIEDLEVTLTALREELHVRAENAGSIVGTGRVHRRRRPGGLRALGKGGYSVPSIVEPEFIQIRRCTADFVLLVEERHPVGTGYRG